MKRISILVLGCLCGIFVSCDNQIIDWQPATDSIAPKTVSNISVENLPGAAKLTYDLPDDEDLAYVEAVYTVGKKTKKSAASVYTNSLIVDGFGSTDAQTVQLFCVDRSGNHSKGVDVVVNPTTPPVRAILESVKIDPAFGGVSIEWANPSEAKVSMGILMKNSDGTVEEIETLYTSAASGNYKLRGLESQPQIFGAYVRDRWNNLSDTLFTELTPLFETKIDSKPFKYYRFPRDENDAGQFSRLFDGNIALGMYTSVEINSSPVFFTIDLGKPVVLSRYVLWHRTANPYANCSPKIWKVYGTLEPDFSKTDTDYWVNGWQNDWELLSDVNNISKYKPSGSDSEITDDDKAAATAGFDLECANTPVRYIRFEITENWVMPVRCVIGELAFYGSYVE